jgi:AP-3 complex subunit delta-1
MSLLYECIVTIIDFGFLSRADQNEGLLALCIDRLKLFLEAPDPNRKKIQAVLFSAFSFIVTKSLSKSHNNICVVRYLGLVALNQLGKDRPKKVLLLKDNILSCMQDQDASIRLRAVDLLCSLVTNKNLKEIVKQLLVQLSLASQDIWYRNQTLTRILNLCSNDLFSFVADFDWYSDLLLGIVRQTKVDVGALLIRDLVQLALCVPRSRSYLVHRIVSNVNGLSLLDILLVYFL